MSGEVELQMQHITHYNPNEVHPALLALREVLENIRTAIAGAQNLPSYLEDGLISIPMSSEQKVALDAQIRSLRVVERMILERYPGVIE